MNIFKKEKRAILGLSLGHFSIDLYAALLVPLYPIITSKLGINLASISAIIALGHLVSSMLQPLFGFIADKLKHRTFMVWGLIFSSVFIPLAVKTPSVALFLTCLLYQLRHKKSRILFPLCKVDHSAHFLHDPSVIFFSMGNQAARTILDSILRICKVAATLVTQGIQGAIAE